MSRKRSTFARACMFILAFLLEQAFMYVPLMVFLTLGVFYHYAWTGPGWVWLILNLGPKWRPIYPLVYKLIGTTTLGDDPSVWEDTKTKKR